MFYLYFFLSIAILSVFSKRYVPSRHVGVVVYGLSFFAAFATGPIRLVVREDYGASESTANLAGFAFMVGVWLIICGIFFFLNRNRTELIIAEKAGRNRFQISGTLTAITKEGDRHTFRLIGEDNTSYTGFIHEYFAQSVVPSEVRAVLEESSEEIGGIVHKSYYLVSLIDQDDKKREARVSRLS